MLRDNLVELIEPMLNSAAADPLALYIHTRTPASDDRLPCLKNPRPEGAESSLTESASSPFQAEPAHALAFRFEDWSFIGITMALVDMLWDTCARLSRSEAVAALLGIPATPEQHDSIHALLFPIQLTLVVSHEYTHHVHGHVLQSALDSTFSNEIVDSHDGGNLEVQALEIDADGYAVYHVLAHLIDGERRSEAVRLL